MKKEKKTEEIISPLDYFDLEDNGENLLEGKETHGREEPRPAREKQKRAVFITGTDTGVGKTVATRVLGALLRSRGLDVGVMKPVQCAGDDAKYLKEALGSPDRLEDINPYFAREPLSPHVAFDRQKTRVEPDRIRRAFERLKERHDILLVEGAGGLLAPLRDNYLMADLARDLGLDVIVVSRPGLGTINHTLLTVRQVRDAGLEVTGVLFCQTGKGAEGVAEKTNPQAVHTIGRVPVLGTVPYLEKKTDDEIVQACSRRINVKPLTGAAGGYHRGRQLGYWDKKYLWHPFTQMQDWFHEDNLIIDRAKGCRLIDVQGRAYLDGVSSLWVNVHGHRHPAIDAAVREQLNKVAHSTMLGLTNTAAVDLAHRLVRVAPRGLERVFYSDDGSTAVEVAVKMAYQYWQNTGKPEKHKIAHLANSYHGDTLGSVSVGGIDLFHKVYDRLTFETVGVDFPDCLRAPEGKTYPDYAFECLDRMEELFARSHETLAALVVEPLVQAAGGMIVWPEGVLKRIREICTKYDVFLIADEVATGFGRTGKMFACEYEGVTPDFLCAAKGLTGGYLPLAATLTTRRVFEGFLFDYKEQKTFFHGHTYTGNPLACAAALASLGVFEKEKTLRALQGKIKYLSEKLKMFYNLPHVGQVRQKGFMVGIELVKDRATLEPYPWEDKIGAKVCQKARDHGVILRPLGNVIVLMPPLAIGEVDLKQLTEAAYRAIQQVTGGEPLPVDPQRPAEAKPDGRPRRRRSSRGRRGGRRRRSRRGSAAQGPKDTGPSGPEKT